MCNKSIKVSITSLPPHGWVQLARCRRHKNDMLLYKFKGSLCQPIMGPVFFTPAGLIPQSPQENLMLTPQQISRNNLGIKLNDILWLEELLCAMKSEISQCPLYVIGQPFFRHFEKNSRTKKLKTQGKNSITQGKNLRFGQAAKL